jgi:hypothetical protein
MATQYAAPTASYSGPSLGDVIRERQRREDIERRRREAERKEWMDEKARRLASQIDFARDQMWVLKGFEKLKGGPLLGDGSCAKLPQIYGGVPLTKYWKPGPKIHGNAQIIPYGTAIATFVNGVYPNWSTGNHAAIFGGPWSGHLKGKLTSGITIFDQWHNKEDGPNWRFVEYGDGVTDRSNDGAAFSVILTAKPMYPFGTRIPVRY